MTTCVDIPGEITARLDAGRLEALVTNRGSISDWSGNGAGFFYPRGSGIPIGKLAGLILGGTVEGDVRVALPWECCDFHPGPIEDGSAVPFEPRFKNYVIRRDGLLDFDWAHWPTDLGAPTDPNGAPLLLGDQTVWSLTTMRPRPGNLRRTRAAPARRGGSPDHLGHVDPPERPGTPPIRGFGF